MTSTPNLASLDAEAYAAREAEIEQTATEVANGTPTTPRAKAIADAMQAALDAEPRDPNDSNDVY